MKTWRHIAAVALAWVLGTVAPLDVRAGINVDSVRQLQLIDQGVQPPLLIGDARFRVAVFAFEDPDKLALGDALATLAMHQLLVGARVSSLGVLRFSDPMAGPRSDELGYFDRIDRLADSQKVTVSVWGAVRRVGPEIAVDTYLQIPQSTVNQALQARIALPKAMGGQELLARIGSDRVLLQRQLLSAATAESVRAAARKLTELRDTPNDQAPVARHVPQETVFYLRELRPPWVRVGSPQGGGWVRSAGHCSGACAPLLDGARFVSSLLAFIEKRQRIDFIATLSPEAAAFADQTAALDILHRGDPMDEGAGAAAILARWSPDGGNIMASPPPGGASSANLRLLARIRGQLLRQVAQVSPATWDRAYEDVRLDPQRVRAAVTEAAAALQADPRNAELLHNLVVLFDYVREPDKARLARELLGEAERSGRLMLLPAR